MTQFFCYREPFFTPSEQLWELGGESRHVLLTGSGGWEPRIPGGRIALPFNKSGRHVGDDTEVKYITIQEKCTYAT